MTWFRRILPAPLLSALLLALWIVLARSASAGQLVLGLVLAIAAPLLAAPLRLTAVRVRRPWVLVVFMLTVGYDVVASNLVVALDVLRWRWRRPRSAFVVVPLELRDPLGLAALAMVTTIVPGTVWSELAVDGSALLLHVWDAPDEAAFVVRFKARYEQPLREIFE
jgi:multicomponent K+:H+ antiporter subunit E